MKISTMIIVVLIVSCVGVALLYSPPFKAGEFIDDLGRRVNIEETPERIISISPTITEILFELGLRDKIVGVSEYCDYPPEAIKIENVSSYTEINLELIASLKPNIIFVGEIVGEKSVKTLENAGLKVFVFKEVESIEGIYAHIKMIGKITGTKNRANELIEEMKKRIEEIREMALGQKKVEVAVLVYPDPLWVIGNGTFTNEMIKIAGGVNVFSDERGFREVSYEKLRSKNPVVIVSFAGHGSEEGIVDYILRNERFKDLTAVKNGEVYGIDEDLLARGGPRVVEGIEELYECFH